ncbi:MAG: hypothetical protein IRZ33_08075 [Alicyclobacillaceae bacterium]|nr:hypothetical protein [Alicyclobacillaceae bacterium]
MRRKLRTVPYAKTRALVNACALVSLTVYALPRLPGLRSGVAGSFTVAWMLFVALAVAANLYFLFGADQERSRQLEMQDIASAEKERRELDMRVRRRAV